MIHFWDAQSSRKKRTRCDIFSSTLMGMRFGWTPREPSLAAGVMTGTSADAIDVALVRIRGRGWQRKAGLVAFHSQPFAPQTRAAILAACDAPAIATAALARLNVWLGEAIGDAVLHTCRGARLAAAQLDFVAVHGQTLYHQGRREPFLGRRIACTWQTGEAAVVAARTGATVISNFRAADMAAGGQGAPLVPFLDYLLLRHPRRDRAALNIGGIANLTLIRAGARPEQVIAFDTGPGNMVMDALAAHFSGGRQRYDQDGRLAARGRVWEPTLARLLSDSYYRRHPPKSCGREQYGRNYVSRLLAIAPRAAAADLLATATALTARTIARALGQREWEVVVGGGGARNPTLMRMLAAAAPRCRFMGGDAFGIPAAAKEAIAFAVLGHATLCGEAGNLPSATGARRAVVLGSITPPP